MQFLSLIDVMSLNKWLILPVFEMFIVMLFKGVPVAYALVGVSLVFIVLDLFVLDPNRAAINEYIHFERTRVTYKKLFANGGRFFGDIIKNPVLAALPMFIFMGLMLDQSGVAQRMMTSMQALFRALKGGLALAVMLLGIILAASTGVIGASVVLLDVMGIPVNGFDVVEDPSVVWFAIVVAMTLQTSFLTSPVGFALLYLKGVCPPDITLSHIDRGVIPFVLLQLLGLAVAFVFLSHTTWLPSVAYAN
ncbi:MAG: TRAP transporter large permease subunit [Aliishimia sp.]